MLRQLHIENMAVIECADLDLPLGFSALTGETGAGKSVLIHSLNLLTGERVSKECIRSGCKKATVCGVFSDLSPAAEKIAAELGVETEDGELIVQRTLSEDGKSTVRVNGMPFSVSALRTLGGALIQIHGQHDNRALLDPETHLSYLDGFAHNGAEISEYQSLYREWKAVSRRLESLTSDERDRLQRLDLLTYGIREIDAASPVIGEDEELERRRSVLIHAERIEESLRAAYDALSGDDGARDLLGRAQDELDRISSVGEEFSSFSDRLSGLSDGVADLAGELRDYLDEMSFDPREAEEVEQRLDLLQRLKKKYGATLSDVLAYRDRAAEEVDGLEHGADEIEALTHKKEELLISLRDAAEKLTESRKIAAKKLEKAVADGLSFLDMPNVTFRVSFSASPSFLPTGADNSEFLFSANAGEVPRSLSKIASGGELSRIMLCMKTVLRSPDDAQTLIFDEIDTGVSGKAAEKIAMKLKEISFGAQVLVVSHLAQMAAYADAQFRIAKQVVGDRTYATVTPLDRTGREEELARILGGLHPTDSSFAAARDWLNIGASYRPE